MKVFKEKVMKELKNRKSSQNELAEQMNISQSNLSGALNSSCKMPKHMFDKICQLLNIKHNFAEIQYNQEKLYRSIKEKTHRLKFEKLLKERKKIMTTTTNTNVQQKGDKTMTKTQNKFNIWDNTYLKLVLAHYKSGEQKEFIIQAKYYHDFDFVNKDKENVHVEGISKVLNHLYKKGALKVAQVNIVRTEDGTNEVYQIYIKDFDIKAKAKNKEGEEYEIFKRFTA